MSGERNQGLGVTPSKLVVAVVWWLWMPVVYFIVKGFMALLMPGIGTSRQWLHLFMVRNWDAADGGVWGLSPWAWLWLTIGAIGTAVIFLAWPSDDDVKVGDIGISVVSVLAALLMFFVPWLKGVYDADQDEAKFYETTAGTHICVADPSLKGHHPTSLDLIYQQKDAEKTEHKDGSGKVDWVKIGPMTIQRCSLPTEVWNFDTRSSSYDGAKRSLQTKTSTRSGVGIFEDTLTYVYGDSMPDSHKSGVKYPQTNRWSALLDGSNYATPMAGVAEWEGGQNATHVCLFGDDPNYNFNRAFGGGHLNSLRNVIAGKYRDLVYDDKDIAGYCDADDHPVVVIAVTRTVGWRAGTVQAPAGILVLRGSKSGNPEDSMTYVPNVEAGQYPVPVYPLSVAQTQREVDSWWSGRGNRENAGYGFDTSDFASQADNSGEYVLHSKTDNGIYAVTPQRPKNSKSQEFINTSMIRVDSVHDGRLNGLVSYVMYDTDPGVVNPSTLNSSAQSILRQSSAGAAFSANHGVLKEFLPVTTSEYRGFGEDSNGSTVLYFDLSTKCGTKATLVSVDPNNGNIQQTTTIDLPCSGAPGQTGTAAPGQVEVNDGACANLNSLKGATLDQIIACNKATQDSLTNKLRQLNGGGASPAPSTSATPSPAPSQS